MRMRLQGMGTTGSVSMTGKTLKASNVIAQGCPGHPGATLGNRKTKIRTQNEFNKWQWINVIDV